MDKKKTDFIAYCGAYCVECPNYTHSIANLAKQLRKELCRNKIEKAVPALAKISAFKAFKHYDKFYQLLELMITFRCKDVCRRGGGSADCKIKRCAIKKGLEGCWLCVKFQKCETLKLLEKYGDIDKTYLKNLRKIKRIGPAEFVKAKSR